MRVINILKDTNPIRLGVLLSATATAKYLSENHGVVSEAWFPEKRHQADKPLADVVNVPVADTEIATLEKMIVKRDLDPKKDIIISHCPWDYQTIWGSHLQKKGFKWIFVPHGTFEPWSLSQKWLKKKIYLTLREKKNTAQADAIRALSTPENNNLVNFFPKEKIQLIPNGIDLGQPPVDIKKNDTIDFIFMARLHYKKGVVPMVKGWVNSKLNNDPKYRLLIAGPDDGELDKIQSFVDSSKNLEYIGPIYREEKARRLSESTFYVLPSKSEGFPVSVLEASSYQLIPMITEGCNFPELFEKNLALNIGMEEQAISRALESAAVMDPQKIETLSQKMWQYVEGNYSNKLIAEKQYTLYQKLFS